MTHKICLISPKVNFSTNIKDLHDFWYSSPEAAPYRNLWSGVGSGLLTIAALTPPSYEVHFIDENFETIDFSEEFDLVGISMMTPQAVQGYKIADEFRKRNVPVVLGGIHPTLMQEEAIQHSDSVLIGEAEYIWPQFLEDFKNDNIQKIYKNTVLVDLKHSPLPRYDLLKSQYYQYIWIQTSRGCPHDCEYCSSTKIFSSVYRTKSIEQVTNEIQLIKKLFNNKPIFFSDDNFLSHIIKDNNLLEVIKKANIKWNAQCDINIGKDGKGFY